jgi:hypothetical protein
VQPNKSTTVQVTDTCGMLEAYAEVDKALADLNGNTAAFRLSEDRAHIEGIAEELASKTLFYGNEKTQPEAFTGLAPRFSSVVAATAQSADNVIDHGGTGPTTRRSGSSSGVRARCTASSRRARRPVSRSRTRDRSRRERRRRRWTR